MSQNGPAPSPEGWSFRLGGYALDRRVLRAGEFLPVTGTVRNEGSEPGTAYVVVSAASSFDHGDVVFGSETHLPYNERTALRIVDIPPASERKFALSWLVPESVPPGHYDIRFEVWNPHRLFRGPHPHLFDRTPWQPAFEVLEPASAGDAPAVFISYSWDGEDHQRWVRGLAEELSRYDIRVIVDRLVLHAGKEVTRFMEEGITQAGFVVLVCSGPYTAKADGRRGGVGDETIVASHEYRHSADRSKFIPVLRNNGLPPGKELPAYLGSSLYVDMRGEDWYAEPLQELVRAIKSPRSPGTS
jgi:hypothetical protein